MSVGGEEVLAFRLVQRAECLADRRRPQVVGRLVLFVVAQRIEAVQVFHVSDPLPLAAHEIEGAGIGEYELAQRHAERPDVVACQLVARRDAHRAGFAMKAVAEAQRPYPAADMARVGFENRHAVSALLELERGDEPGESGADDHHV